MDQEKIKKSKKPTYEAPKVLASYDREELEEAILPHGVLGTNGGGCGCGCGG